MVGRSWRGRAGKREYTPNALPAPDEEAQQRTALCVRAVADAGGRTSYASSDLPAAGAAKFTNERARGES